MATSIVTIGAPDKVVTCDAQGSTQHVFNVKNTSGQTLTIGAKVLVDGATEESWLQVDAPAEQELGDNVLTQIPVKIQVPPDGVPDRWALWPEPEPLVAVPNLKGQRFDLALPKIAQAGFTFNAENLQHRKAGETSVGNVIDQKPPGNSKAAKGTEIVLTVVESPTGVVIPSAVSKQLMISNPYAYKLLMQQKPRSVEPAPE